MSDYDFSFDDLADGEKVATRARIFEELARGRYKDYAQVTKPAIERMNNDDDFRHELSQSSDPAELLYQTGQALTPQSLGDILEND